jgi:hypothetical protein
MVFGEKKNRKPNNKRPFYTISGIEPMTLEIRNLLTTNDAEEVHENAGYVSSFSKYRKFKKERKIHPTRNKKNLTGI